MAANAETRKHPNSEDSTRSELVMTVPPTDVSVLKTEWEYVYPANSPKKNDDPLVFTVTSDGSSYYDYFNSQLYVRAKITNHDKTNLATAELAAPTNAFFHAWISDIENEINNVNVSKFGSLSPYVGYLTNLLGSSPDQKQNELQNILFYPPKQADTFTAKTDPTCGFTKRAKLAQESKVFEMIGKLPIDICYQNKYLPPSAKVKITLRRSLAQFCIDANKEEIGGSIPGCPFRYVIEEAVLIVPKHKVDEKAIVNHGKLVYPVCSPNVKTYTISSGNISHIAPSFINGNLPQQIYIGLVSNSAFNGNVKKSPFNFQHFGMQSISLSINGQDQVYKTIHYDFVNDKYLEGLATLKDAAVNPSLGNGLCRENFLNGKLQHN